MNPYDVLGIRQGAGQDEIRAAYREKVKQYHPDQYKGHPLAGLAEEKLREINEAYEVLIKNNGAGATGASYSGSRSGGANRFSSVRMHLQQNNLNAAQQLLDSISDRSAEWHYLQGVVYLRKGWYDKAREHLGTAAGMEPDNSEFVAAFNSLNNMQYNYRQGGYRRGGMDNATVCNVCTTLYCADCCCECMGGDLIRCC
ncbi:MAG: DnaJ domain-containing protein [Christensenellales bacterium]|jgi:molecular chaperone DnaJ